MSMFLITEDGDARLESYDATTKGATTLLRVTVKVTDAYALAHMLESLGRIKQAQASANAEAPAKPTKAPKQGNAAPATRLSSTRSKSLSHQPLLALPPPDWEPV